MRHPGFANIEFSINDIFGQADKLVTWRTFKGNHMREFFGIVPTGRRIVLEGATLMRMNDCKIAEERDFFDNFTFMQQLRLIAEA